ncbi:RidA family protein [Wolinella succinogenes]|uniref:RidA family protein n=1 Tax=Wolinella succinogenes TaxID=844 RepID=UPI002409958C|nr:RidA family protein [Wolinella succinogenes]
MKFISTDQAPAAIGPYSQAIVVNDMIFTSGQIALRPEGSMEEGDVEAQTRQVLTNLKGVLESEGSTLSKVIKTTVFLAHMEDFAKMNGVYAEFFGEHKPARSTVAVKTLPRNALVEIECIALK